MNKTLELDLDYLHARTLLLPAYDVISLALIGCGGTGSWLAPSVARVARLLIEKFQKKVEITFIDPDVVEQKNCYRQNFCEAEIGRNKAETLAFRYGLAWGLAINAIAEPFKWPPGPQLNSSLLSNTGRLMVFVGCVDNPAARKAIQMAVTASYRSEAREWWLDCGNHQAAGQVLLGCGAKEPKNAFELPERCAWLPLPTVLHPELIEPAPVDTLVVDSQPNTENLSCADLAMLDSQGLAINQRIAAEATDYLVRLLLTRDLRKYATYIDLASGTTRSKYIVKEEGEDVATQKTS